jgi:uncharacterized membrane protein YphA (DoxX/SURF4 family)
VIWIPRILLAAFFIFFGVVKFPSDPRSLWVHIFELIGFGQWFRVVTAVVETVGGALLLVPRATPIAVVLLVPTMIGALLTHVFVVGIGRQSVLATVLMLGVLGVGWHYRRSRSA